MTDADIIKALECCPKGVKCEYCHIHGTYDCMTKLYENALDLINRQKTEIEELKDREENISIICKGAEEKYHELYEEAKVILIRKSRTEAVKEFATRLKEKQIEVDVSDGYGKPCSTGAVTVIEIDNILEEFVR